MARKSKEHRCGLDSKLVKVNSPLETPSFAIYRCDKCEQLWYASRSNVEVKGCGS